MNERIVELAKQCASEDHLAIYGGNYAKFAQLIVRECAKVANDSNQSKNRAVGVSVGDVVREHFGVEE